MPEKSRLLVLDDDKAHAEAAAESLERAGYQCTIATSGTEGLKLLESKPFDLILATPFRSWLGRSCRTCRCSASTSGSDGSLAYPST